MSTSTSHQASLKIPATYMRGGTSKGIFFSLNDLPLAAQQAGAYRDALFMRIIGSPDPYAKQIDGMGGATSSTSKTVIVNSSSREGFDVDYLFGQVAIDTPFVDWSGNCGNLSAAVGAFAIERGLVHKNRLHENGVAQIRIWQMNIQKPIVAHIPMKNGQVQENGDFELDGVTFPAAEIQLEFMNPANEGEGDNAAIGMFPTGHVMDNFVVPDFDGKSIGTIAATFINSGIPTIFVNAKDIGYTGLELQDAINADAKQLAFFEHLRAHGALRMGLIRHIDEAKNRQHTPKIAFVAPAQSYVASNGKIVDASDIHLCVRALSMGKLHHAMMGTCAVAIGTAAAIEGTIVAQIMGGAKSVVNFGHPSGTLRVGAEAIFENDKWEVKKAVMSRSARVLMEGWVRVPEPSV